MKLTSRTLSYLAATAVALAPVVAVAQAPRGERYGERHREHHGEHRGRSHMKERVVQYLELDEQQLAAWNEIQDEIDSLERDSVAELRDIHRRIDDELASADPDAESLGLMMIEAHGSRQALRTLREDFNERVTSILRADQLERWEALRAMRPERGRGPHGRRSHRGHHGRD